MIKQTILNLTSLGVLLFPGTVFSTVNEVVEINLEESSVEQAFQGRKIVLTVGIDKFRDQSYQPLRYTTKDVEDINQFLKSNNNKSNDLYISLTGQQASTTSFLSALDQIQLANTSKDDIVLIYLSTHGTLDYQTSQDLRRYVVFNDTNSENVAKTGISIDYIQNRLARMKSEKKAAIFALCHSGSGKSMLPGHIRDEKSLLKGFFAKPIQDASSALMILSASSWGEPAREDPDLQNDIYTHFLIRGLERNDANGDGAISLFEAHEYARSMTYDFTRGRQTPTALINVSGIDPIILKGRIDKRPYPLLFADNDRFRNLQIYVDGTAKGTLWNPKKLEAGRVRLTLVDPKVPDTPLLDNHMVLSEGQSYPVSALFARRPSVAVGLTLQSIRFANKFASTDTKDFFLPGITARFDDVLGSRMVATTSITTLTHSSTMQVDYNETNLNHTFQQAQIAIGYSFGLTPNQKISPFLGATTLSVARHIENESFKSQSQRTMASFLVSGIEYKATVINSVFTSASMYSPVGTNAGVRFSDGFSSLSRVQGSLNIGYSF